MTARDNLTMKLVGVGHQQQHGNSRSINDLLPPSIDRMHFDHFPTIFHLNLLTDSISDCFDSDMPPSKPNGASGGGTFAGSAFNTFKAVKPKEKKHKRDKFNLTRR